MIKLTSRGDFKHTEQFFDTVSKKAILENLEHYGQVGVDALSAATPVDTGKTAASWSYRVEYGNGTVSIVWSNSNENQGIPIVVLIRYGHGVRGGGYASGLDLISPALAPVFPEIADSVWKAVTSA